MRIVLAVGWLMLPVAAGAYHYGPGQERLQMGQVASALSDADNHAENNQWSQAVEKYNTALTLLPPGQVEQARRIRLERAKAQMLARELPAAHADLKSLLAELDADSTADANLLAQCRRTLAGAQYYMTWLMRLEGQPNDAWEPEIEAARQNYRLLAAQAESAGNAALSTSCREDLEAAIRLSRMSLAELQGLPLPSQ